jgi:hypothetical protein
MDCCCCCCCEGPFAATFSTSGSTHVSSNNHPPLVANVSHTHDLPLYPILLSLSFSYIERNLNMRCFAHNKQVINEEFGDAKALER